MTEEKRKPTFGELCALEVAHHQSEAELAEIRRTADLGARTERILAQLRPKERAIVEARLAASPPAPAGLPRVRVEVLRAACAVQGWKLSAASDGSWFVMTSETASVRYESPRLPQMTARGPFDEVLDMIAVVASAALGK